jgi:hypothetical protein
MPKIGMKQKRLLLRLMSFWPPFLGAGIRVVHLAPDLRRIVVRLELRWWNANYVGTAFGGSLFAMTDPFYMLMLIEALGPAFVVWDKASSIRFRRPGRGPVTAEFVLTDARLAELRATAESRDKFDAPFTAVIKDGAGEVVAEVEKTISIRKKQRAATAS